MFLTIDELYELKEKYLDELRKAEAKISVISELVKMAESKEPIKEEEVGEFAGEVESECETSETKNY